MKRHYFILAGIAALGLASCSQDDLSDLSGGDGNLHITVSLPRDMATRAFGEGKASTTLDYAIYDVTNNQEPQFSFQDKATFPEGSLTTTLNLNLIEGKSYRIAFFASAPNNGVYTFSPSSETPNISVNYAAMTGEGANSDLYDCFFKMTDAIAITGNLAPQSVTLERPVAQINWGTNDMYSNPEIEKVWGTTEENSYIQSNLTVTGTVYQQLNILTGELDESSLTKIEIFKDNQEAAPIGNGFPVDPSTYNYVACQYLLAPATPNATYSLTLNINNTNNSTIKKQIQVDNAPLQANYRTNIYGNLLSTNTTFTVTKSADWSEPGYEEVLDIQSLLNAIARGGNIYLQNDLVCNVDLNLGEQVTSFNLNGHNLKLTNSATIWVKGENANVTFEGEGTVTTVSTDPSKTTACIGVTDGAKATINGGSYISDQLEAVYIYEGGEVTINGGYFANANGYQGSYFTLNCWDTAYREGISKFIVNGGTFENFDPASTLAEGSPAISWVSEGYKSVKYTDNGKTLYTVVPSDAIVVAGDNTLADALNNAKDGDTILVMAGTFQTPSTFDKSVTIKGVGAELSFLDTKNAYFQSEGANLTFEDLSFNGFANPYNHTSMGIQGASNQTFNNVTFHGEFHVFTGNATFNNCDFVYDSATGTNYQLWCQTKGTVDVNNCTMECANGRAILVYGWPGASGQPANNTVGGNININGLTVTSTGNSSDKAVVEIHSELYTSAGTININNLTYSPQSDFAGLWRDVNSTTKFYTVYVNGKLAQQGNN